MGCFCCCFRCCKLMAILMLSLSLLFVPFSFGRGLGWDGMGRFEHERGFTHGLIWCVLSATASEVR